MNMRLFFQESDLRLEDGVDPRRTVESLLTPFITPLELWLLRALGDADECRVSLRD